MQRTKHKVQSTKLTYSAGRTALTTSSRRSSFDPSTACNGRHAVRLPASLPAPRAAVRIGCSSFRRRRTVAAGTSSDTAESLVRLPYQPESSRVALRRRSPYPIPQTHRPIPCLLPDLRSKRDPVQPSQCTEDPYHVLSQPSGQNRGSKSS